MLSCLDMRESFLKTLSEGRGNHQRDDADIDEKWNGFRHDVAKAAAACIPLKRTHPKRPWISKRTLKLVDERFGVRLQGNWEKEKSLRMEARTLAQHDRANWITNLAGKGDWQSLQRLYRKSKPAQTRLRNSGG